MMTLTKYGIREWGFYGVLAVLLLAGCVFLGSRGYTALAWGVGVFVAVVYLALAAFFRNPDRRIPEDPRVLVSPADGVVRDIEVVEDFNFVPFTGKALRVGVFLSVFDVHVNRASAAMRVESKFYREGEFLDARHAECAKRNEAMTIAGTATAAGRNFPMAIRQISGAIARRIVCPVEPGCSLERGEIYGMIKFGSRTELYLPVEGFELNVKVGDRVHGGSTIMATMKE